LQTDIINVNHAGGSTFIFENNPPPPEGGKHEKEEKRKAYMEINRRNRKISIKHPVPYRYAIDGR
jgi:hypothetical protein